MSLILRSTSWKEMSSSGACLSVYMMLRSAEVHAPPARPAAVELK